MAWLAVDENEEEYIYEIEPYREDCTWSSFGCCVSLPKGSIKKLIGRELTWEDETVEFE